MARHKFRNSVLAVACAVLVGVLFAGASHADETCNSPYMPKLITGQEDYVYVWTLGVEGVGDGSDKLVTVDVHPKSKTLRQGRPPSRWARAARRTTWASPTTAASSGRAASRTARSTSSTSRPIRRSRSS